MPMVMVSQADSREQYEAVQGRVEMASNRPEGLILHSAAETPTGEIQIVDVWESPAHMDAFGRERLFPAFEAAGIMQQITARPRPVAYEAFDHIA